MERLRAGLRAQGRRDFGRLIQEVSLDKESTFMAALFLVLKSGDEVEERLRAAPRALSGLRRAPMWLPPTELHATESQELCSQKPLRPGTLS